MEELDSVKGVLDSVNGVLDSVKGVLDSVEGVLDIVEEEERVLDSKEESAGQCKQGCWISSVLGERVLDTEVKRMGESDRKVCWTV